jgi:hypothetical protein
LKIIGIDYTTYVVASVESVAEKLLSFKIWKRQEKYCQTWPVSANLDIVDEILIVCKDIFNMLSVGS